MTVLKSEIYTNNFFPPKKVSCQSLKKRFLLIANYLINLLRQLKKDQKATFFKFENNFFVDVKTIYVFHFSFAINFLFKFKMSFKK